MRNLLHDGSVATAHWQDTEPYWTRCSVCACDFPTRATTAPRFCSERCRQRMAYQQKIYMQPALCRVCQQEFLTSKYRPRPTCSRRCGRILAWRNRAEKG